MRNAVEKVDLYHQPGAVLALIARYGQVPALEAASYIKKTKVSTVNRYRINEELPLRLPAAWDIAVGDLLKVMKIRSPQEGSA